MDQPVDDGRSLLVLVADDEAAIRDLVCEVLSDAGFRTVTASDGDQAAERAIEHQPAVVILDVMMPNLDGYTTLTRLRGHPMTRNIPVIVLTGQAEPVYRTLSAGVGAVAHLTKPFSPSQLTDTVRRVLAEQPA
jgi:CheY-like chemotaxis protein